MSFLSKVLFLNGLEFMTISLNVENLSTFVAELQQFCPFVCVCVALSLFIYFFVFFLTFLLEYNCFTMVC